MGCLQWPICIYGEFSLQKWGGPILFYNKHANALSVPVDELLCDNIVHSKAIFEKELSELMEDCSDKETYAIVEIAKTTKAVFRKTMEL